jgi:hypothetical protein
MSQNCRKLFVLFTLRKGKPMLTKLINYLGKIDPAWAESIDNGNLRTYLYLLASVPFIAWFVVVVMRWIWFYILMLPVDFY